MARLEFEFVSVGANGIDNDINKINNNFKGLHGTIEQNIQDNLQLANQLKEVRQQLKETGNSNVALSQTQRELQQRYNDSNAVIRQQINAFDKTDGSLAQMRSSLSLANRAFDNLNKTAREGSIGQNLSKQIATLTDEIKKAEQATGRFQRNVGNYQQAQSGANGVTMEFNRIIQDAPFGMMGVGNNIQQLSENWKVYTAQAKAAAVANGTTVTTMGLVKGALAGIFSPLNLLSLGIAAVTSGWILYEKWQQKANKASKEGVDIVTKHKEALTGLERVQISSISNYQAEISKLETLYKIATNNNRSLSERKYALEQLQSLYPKVFSNLDLNALKNDKVTTSYDNLKNSIISAAMAQGAYNRMAELSEKIQASKSKELEITEKISDAERKLANNQKRRLDLQKQPLINRLQGAGGDFFNREFDKYDAKSGRKERAELQAQRKKDEQEFLKLSYDVENVQANITDIQEKGTQSVNRGNTARASSVKQLKEAYDYLSKIRDLISGKQKDIDLINVDGQAKDLIELEYKWEEYFNKIADLNNKLQKDIKNKSISSAEAEKVKEGLKTAGGMGDDLMLSEQAEILKKYQDIRLEIIRKANEEAGIFEQQSRETDLAKQKIWLDEKLKNLVKNGADIKQAMEDMLPADLMRTYNINIKWDNKDLEEWGKINDKIQETIDKPFSGQNSKSIQAELEKRIGMLKKLLEQLAKATGVEFDNKEFDKMSAKLKENADNQKTNKQLEKDIQDYVTIANNGLNSIFTNLKSNIDEFGLKARSVFYTLGETLGDLIKQLANKNTAKFMESITKDAKSFSDLKDNWKNMSSQDKWSAGLGFAGNAVSNLTPQTSSGGQALGGALSGAAAGMAFGPWGAAIGAVVGGISGLLKSAKNRRQEKILLQQYEEQKKANALLERMNALTYASQIIGQKTEYGIVSGVRRNEYGQIVSVIQGQDIIMVADRTNKQKGR